MDLYAVPSIKSEEIVRELLSATKIDIPPTDGEIIAAYLNLKVIEFDDKFGLHPDIRAFLFPSQRLIGIHKTLPPKQKNFSILHEIGHFVLPGHANDPSLVKDGKILDNNVNLGAKSIIKLEIEANQFAADCLFQLERFTLEIHSKELSWPNIQNTAEEYNASFEATARRWVEKSKQECALVVFNPQNRERKSPLEIMYTITSESFKHNYFERLVPGHEMGSETPMYKYFFAESGDDEVHITVNINTTSKGPALFLMKLFSNSYRLFGLVTPLESEPPF